MSELRGPDCIDALLRKAARTRPRHPYLVTGSGKLTMAALDVAVDGLAAGLAARGVRAGDRVPVMMDNHREHVLVFFALQRLRAVMVPVNTRLMGESLRYLLHHCEPAHLVADASHAAALLPAWPASVSGTLLWRGVPPPGAPGGSLEACLHGARAAGTSSATPDDVIAILYTSGTTGPPKGVQVTDHMLRTAAEACARVSAAADGETYYMWEPLYHVGGSQLLVMALVHAVTLWMSPRFSVSRFWDEVRESRATRIHYLGGVLQMLLRQPPGPHDREHGVPIAYGGGAPPGPWREFEQRFGVQIRESYGMTECSSFTSINVEGRFGAVGRPAPWFEVRLLDAQGATVATGETGEIVVRAREPGVMTPGYFRNEAATARTIRDGWMYTGDLGRFDADGFLYYAGRAKDCIRRRGENISAWEIERVAEQMASVAESAAVGVPDDLGDETIKLYVRAADGHEVAPDAVHRWCAEHLAAFQVPEFIEVVAAFDKTGTERIRKESLPRVAGAAWRREAAG